MSSTDLMKCVWPRMMFPPSGISSGTSLSSIGQLLNRGKNYDGQEKSGARQLLHDADGARGTFLECQAAPEFGAPPDGIGIRQRVGRGSIHALQVVREVGIIHGSPRIHSASGSLPFYAGRGTAVLSRFFPSVPGSPRSRGVLR